MTTRISSEGPAVNVATVPTAARTTATPARPFRQVMAASASAVIQGAEQAVTRLPGGPLLAAALRPAPSSSALPGQSPEGAATAIGGSAIPASPLTGAGVTSLGGTSGQSPGVEGVLAQGVDQNMYFLELQERISQEGRTYSALSNVLKARHDTMKNAIGNIR